MYWLQALQKKRRKYSETRVSKDPVRQVWVNPDPLSKKSILALSAESDGTASTSESQTNTQASASTSRTRIWSLAALQSEIVNILNSHKQQRAPDNSSVPQSNSCFVNIHLYFSVPLHSSHFFLPAFFYSFFFYPVVSFFSSFCFFVFSSHVLFLSIIYFLFLFSIDLSSVIYFFSLFIRSLSSINYPYLLTLHFFLFIIFLSVYYFLFPDSLPSPYSLISFLPYLFDN
ncbi:unnamed protein product [Acanthosepion pharaonis]|uniref:Uncharacterized protein n=1 Tax=Acanthosepion pharaonis TaxID=158019 RepID=A0A812CWH3_ACAPH|nr:unnamed protein product [Sepia pharaonis]